MAFFEKIAMFSFIIIQFNKVGILSKIRINESIIHLEIQGAL